MSLSLCVVMPYNRMMQRIFYYIILIIYICITFNQAFSNDLKIRGTHNYTYYVFDVYQATLFMDKKCHYPQCNFVLQINYKSAFDGIDIVESSIQEINNQHNLDAKTKNIYKGILGKIFPNVKQDDIIKGEMLNGKAIFYLNNKFIGKINDTQLAQYFFDIWLSPKTSEPKMRQTLLGN
jgi:hypothetical protein